MSNNKKFKKRTFKKILLIGVTISALSGLTGCGKENKKEENNATVSTTEVTTEKEKKPTISKKDFNNDNIKVDESYKNLEYKGNGETIDDYVQKNGVPTSGKPEDTVTTKEIPNVDLPSKPEDTEKTEVMPEKVEPTTEAVDDKNNNKTDDPKKDDKKNDKEKVTIIEKEEKPSDNDPSQIDESTTETKKEEVTTEDNIPTDSEEKPDFKDPEIIEEDDDDITYISSLKNSYIALKSALLTEQANMNKAKSLKTAEPVLTYTSSKNC